MYAGASFSFGGGGGGGRIYHLQTTQCASKCWSSVGPPSWQEFKSINTLPPPPLLTTPFTGGVVTTTGDFITDELAERGLAAVVDGVGGGGDVTAKEEEEERRRESCRFFPPLALAAVPRRAITPLGVAAAPRFVAAAVTFFWFHSGTVRLSGSRRFKSSWYWAIRWRSSALCCPADSASCKTVLQIHDILVWIRIRGSMPLTNGSRSCYFRH